MTKKGQPRQHPQKHGESHTNAVEYAFNELTSLFALLTADPVKNIDIIVQKTCEILDGACSLYNRLDDQSKSLVVWSEYKTPPDLKREDTPYGHICYEATIKGKNKPVILEELLGTPYEESDPNVKKYNLRSYLGYPVHLDEKAIGSLCIVDTKPRAFDKSELKVLIALAKALSIEEARKSADDKLRRSEENFRNIFNSTSDGILVHDGETQKLIDINKRACEIYGYSEEEIKSIDLSQLNAVDEGFTIDRAKKIIADVIDKGPQRFQWRARHKSGKSFWVEIDLKLDNIGGKNSFLSVVRDINDHVLHDIALTESEQRFRALSEATFEGIIISDKGVFVDANQSAARMFGYTYDEFVGINGTDVIAPESKERVKKNMLSGNEEPYEAIAMRKDGTTFPAEFQGRIYSYKDKEVRVTAVRDISDRKKAQAALKESQRMLRLIMDTIPVRVFWKNRDSEYLGCNLPFAKDAGFSHPKEVIGKDDYSCAWTKEADLYRADDQYVIKSGKSKLAYEEPQTRPNGELTWLRTSKIPLKDAGGEIIGMLGTYENITEKKLAEQALRESEEKYRNLIQHSTDAIYLLYNRKFELINDKFQEMFGLTLEDVNKPEFDFMDLVSEKSRPLIEERLKKFAAGEKIKSKYEFTAITSNGEQLEVETSVSRIKYKEGIATQGIIRDVTARKRLEEQVRHTQKIEAVGRLAGGVAHDFNNLLTVINGYCELLLHRDIASNVREKIDQIYQAGIKASRLTSQLLAFSRKQVIQPKILNLNTIITEMNKMLHRLLGEDIEIETVLNPEVGTIKADPGQLEQIIINLAVNARDAMPSGGKLFIESDNVTLDEHFIAANIGSNRGDFVMLSIRDTGAGMDEETKSHIFEPFFTTKERGKGTGLGLSTVYGIVKQNAGYINFESSPHEGTVFNLYFPIASEIKKSLKRNLTHQKSLNGDETILLVEDDPGVRELTLSVLNRYGYHVLKANDGEEALKIVDNFDNKIHLLLTDVIMPKMSGKELADILSSRYTDLKIIFFSGYTEDGIVQHGVLEPGTQFIQKPFSQQILVEKIRSVLDQT